MDQGLEQFVRGEWHSNEEGKVKKKEKSGRSSEGKHNRARDVLG